MTTLNSLRKLSELIAALDKGKTPVRAVGGQMIGLEQYILRVTGNELETLRQAAQALAEQAKNDARYRWLRSEEVCTEPRYYEFWNRFLESKLVREDSMDKLIDEFMPTDTALSKGSNHE